ncbi:MAG: ATP-binding protein, partial [Pseudonocardiaceae bacterium]
GVGRRTEEREIDIVGVDAHGRPNVIGMCKWTSTAVDFDELNLLDRLAPHVDSYNGTAQRFLCSRGGFSRRLRVYAAEEPQLTLVTPADIYA